MIDQQLFGQPIVGGTIDEVGVAALPDAQEAVEGVRPRLVARVRDRVLVEQRGLAAARRRRLARGEALAAADRRREAPRRPAVDAVGDAEGVGRVGDLLGAGELEVGNDAVAVAAQLLKQPASATATSRTSARAWSWWLLRRPWRWRFAASTRAR